MKSLTNYAVITINAIFVASCTSDPNTDNTLTTSTQDPFIVPAIAGVDVPFKKYEVNAESGDTIFYNSGSVIIIPPNSLLDKNGVVVTGKVDITYREFSDPVDFFLSGIPMSYDSGGVNYTFESAAMCEIYASQNGEPVFVNPLNKPEINLATFNKDAAQNLYYLDTVARQWIYTGKDLITDLKSEPVIKTVAPVKEDENKLTPPTPPRKADMNKPSFVIIIEPGSVRELTVYNNMKFEVDEDEQNYNPKSNVEYWNDVKVENTNKKGTYRVTFTNKNESVSYLGKPVYEGKDYDEALKEFELKQRDYEKLVRQREADQEKTRKEIEKQNLLARVERDKIDRMKKLIEKREREEEENNRRIFEAEAAKRRKQLEQIKKQQEEFAKKEKEREQQAFKEGGVAMSQEVYRTFTLARFGTWNVDKPINQPSVTVFARFEDNSGNILRPKNICVVNRDLNGINSFPSANVSFMLNNDNMIWAVMDKKFMYLTYEDYKKCNITQNTRDYTFTMKIHDGEINSREDIKRIVGI